MANIRFLWSNRYSASTTTLTASSSVSALPVNATKNVDRSYVWRSSTSTGTPTIDIDLGSVLAVTCAALANAKVVGAGVIELYHRGDAGSPGAATLVATFAAQDRDTRAVAAVFASQSHRHWQLKWTNPGSARDYAELGYAFLGTYTEPAVNVRVPLSISRQDPSVLSESSDGQESYAERTKFLIGACPFDAVLEAQLSQLREIFDTIGVRTPLFIVLDSTLGWMTWFVRWSGPLAIEVEPGGAISRYGVQMPWREVR